MTNLSKGLLEENTASKKMNTDAELLLDTRDSFRDVKSSIVRAMRNLYEVHERGSWATVATSWSEYVESDLGISQGFASKLLSVNRHYLVEGGFYPENIEGIDYEKLYLAAKSGGTVEEQIAKARTLTRAELKQTNAEEKPHEPSFGEYCSVCWLSKANHP